VCTLLGRRKKPEDARGVNFSCGPFFFAARTHGLTCRRSSPTRSRMPTCLGRWSVPLAGDCIWSTRRRVAWPGTTNSIEWLSGMRKRQIFYPFVSRQLSYLTHIYCSCCSLVASGLFGKMSPRPVYSRKQTCAAQLWMSAKGHKRTYGLRNAMSALTPKADIAIHRARLSN